MITHFVTAPFLLCAIFEVRGLGERWRRLAVYPKVDGPSGRGLRQPPGPSALGAKGLVRDRLRLPDGLRAPPRVVI